MPTFEDIRDQISYMNEASKLLERKEVKQLPNILWEEEEIEKLVLALYENRIGVLVATNKRLIFVNKGLLNGFHVEDFPYDKVTSIQYKTGVVLGEITIFTSENKAFIEGVEKEQTINFCEYVIARMTVAKESISCSLEAHQSYSLDLADQIKKLADLRDQGILTEEEFITQKRKFLGV